jgi:TBC1 domain family member 10
MVTCGLESECAAKVFLVNTKASDAFEQIEFSSYALVGLANFFRLYPDKFKSRLSKGPPPSFRWLAWTFAASLIVIKEKGLYEALLQEGAEGSWLHDIDKDLNRTFPTLPYFSFEKYGVIG